MCGEIQGLTGLLCLVMFAKLWLDRRCLGDGVIKPETPQQPSTVVYFGSSVQEQQEVRHQQTLRTDNILVIDFILFYLSQFVS